MDFGLDDDQRLLKDSVDRLLAQHYAFAARQHRSSDPLGYSADMWSRFAELGLLAMPFAQDDGGLGLGPVETMIVMEAFGGALVIEPYLATVILGGGLIRHGGDAAQRAMLAQKIGDGTHTLAFAHAERRARYDLSFVETTAREHGGGWLLDGDKSLVLHGDSARTLIVSARVAGAATDQDGLALFLVEGATVKRRGYATQDGMRAAEVALRDTPGTALGTSGKAWPIITRAVDETIAALCAEAVGAMAALVALTVDFLKTRHQFGVAIGSFQALQHRATEMVVALEQARSMALYATMMIVADDPKARARAIRAAKVQIGRSSKVIAEQAVQLHGGIGMTEEYSVGHYMKRLTMIEQAFGDTGHHLAVLATAGGLRA